jgi:hypothetical protein
VGHESGKQEPMHGFDPTLNVHGTTLMDDVEVKVGKEGEDVKGWEDGGKIIGLGCLTGCLSCTVELGLFSLKSTIPEPGVKFKQGVQASLGVCCST